MKSIEQLKKEYPKRLSPHFEWWEFLYSRKAEELKIDNTPSEIIMRNIRILVDILIEPLRVKWGLPIAIAGKDGSGYRSKALNEAVGGVKTSQHLQGLACDCHVTEPPVELARCLVKSGLNFDQCVLYQTFVHISYSPFGRNRKQIVYDKNYKGERV